MGKCPHGASLVLCYCGWVGCSPTPLCRSACRSAKSSSERISPSPHLEQCPVEPALGCGSVGKEQRLPGGASRRIGLWLHRFGHTGQTERLQRKDAVASTGDPRRALVPPVTELVAPLALRTSQPLPGFAPRRRAFLLPRQLTLERRLSVLDRFQPFPWMARSISLARVSTSP